ncbi:MAG: HU family DNA-binding protein [Candidatus Electrothrix scaldis]|nr:MAG: HU family DNA-binding protein [Candidatus Electrothrix sp. GW3-3]
MKNSIKLLGGKSMNKLDLVKTLAQSANISKADAERGLVSLLQTMRGAIEDGERINLVGFGSFSVIDRAPRVGRNPKTGEQVKIPSRRSVKFCPGQALKEVFF